MDIDLPGGSVDVLRPTHIDGLLDEAASFLAAVRDPIGTEPLHTKISATDRVALVIPDITRPFPSDRVLPWLLEELCHVPPDNFVIINGTGSHRSNTPEELTAMLGREIAAKYRVVNHDSYDRSSMVHVGETAEGVSVHMNREYVEADKRIVLGFIEPHFFAGFSGGYKAVFPGIVDINSIMHYHRGSVIGDPRSTWGIVEGNPTQDHVRSAGSLLPVDFCINVTLNSNRAITRFFCGDVIPAHDAGCAFAKSTAMIECETRYPVVVTTNGGYPLDQNLYQAVKGMSAAAQVVERGGLIVAAAECCDGFPEHGNFKQLLFDHASPQELIEAIETPGFSVFDQWEAQTLAVICREARIALCSMIADDDVVRAHLEPVKDIGARVTAELESLGGDARIAVLPEGPMTIPYVLEMG